jgi:UDP-N-acetylglucosamine:LPS N-acetylglucosamine transferase
MKDDKQRQEMARACKEVATLDAAYKIAEKLLDYPVAVLSPDSVFDRRHGD